jgi:hypothetical protein
MVRTSRPIRSPRWCWPRGASTVSKRLRRGLATPLTQPWMIVGDQSRGPQRRGSVSHPSRASDHSGGGAAVDRLTASGRGAAVVLSCGSGSAWPPRQSSKNPEPTRLAKGKQLPRSCSRPLERPGVSSTRRMYRRGSPSVLREACANSLPPQIWEVSMIATTFPIASLILKALRCVGISSGDSFPTFCQIVRGVIAK